MQTCQLHLFPCNLQTCKIKITLVNELGVASEPLEAFQAMTYSRVIFLIREYFLLHNLVFFFKMTMTEIHFQVNNMYCDQIGRLLKVLGNTFLTNIWLLLGFLENITLNLKSHEATFWASFLVCQHPINRICRIYLATVLDVTSPPASLSAVVR